MEYTPDRPLESAIVLKSDLAGSGQAQPYTWVQPDTGILVWDPWSEGRIRSGRQLFGSVTFHMFWSDGYRALDALDDNRDGELRGNELKGLAAWFDRESPTPEPRHSLLRRPKGECDRRRQS